jgi:hypothetical protein
MHSTGQEHATRAGDGMLPAGPPRRPCHVVLLSSFDMANAEAGSCCARCCCPRRCAAGRRCYDSSIRSAGGGCGRQRSFISAEAFLLQHHFPWPNFAATRRAVGTRCAMTCPKRSSRGRPRRVVQIPDQPPKKPLRPHGWAHSLPPAQRGGGQGKQKAPPGLAVCWHLTPEGTLEPAAVCTLDIAASTARCCRPIESPAAPIASCVLYDVHPQFPATQELQTCSDQDGGTSMLWAVDLLDRFARPKQADP